MKRVLMILLLFQVVSSSLLSQIPNESFPYKGGWEVFRKMLNDHLSPNVKRDDSYGVYLMEVAYSGDQQTPETTLTSVVKDDSIASLLSEFSKITISNWDVAGLKEKKVIIPVGIVSVCDPTKNIGIDVNALIRSNLPDSQNAFLSPFFTPIYICGGICGDALEIHEWPGIRDEKYEVINAVLALEKAKKIWLRNKFLGFAEPMVVESGIRKISSKEFLRRTYLFKEIRLDDFYADGDFEAMRSQQYDEPEDIDTAAINKEGLRFAKPGSFDIKWGEDGRFLTITKPLFSLDRTKAVIYVEASCWDGCNNGSAYVMRKQKDTLKWEFAYTVNVWVE